MVAGLIGGVFIVTFSGVGVFARAEGLVGSPSVAAGMALGLPLMLVFNVIMVVSAGSPLDSTFTSTAKLAARDWRSRPDAAADADGIRPAVLARGRWFMVGIAVLGNLPLLTIYFGEQAGPVVIAATTISGTMVMGLAPVFLLAFIPGAGRLSFHLAFWPGLALGVLMGVDGLASGSLVPAFAHFGSGKYADDLGINILGLGICTAGYLVGAVPANLGLARRGGIAYRARARARG